MPKLNNIIARPREEIRKYYRFSKQIAFVIKKKKKKCHRLFEKIIT